MEGRKPKKQEKTPRQAGEKTGESLNMFLRSMVFAEEERRGVFSVFFNMTVRMEGRKPKKQEKNTQTSWVENRREPKYVFCEAWFSPRRNDEGFLMFSLT